jgi:phosphoglycolate phosphatase-like HAD superfamily hydrolase
LLFDIDGTLLDMGSAGRDALIGAVEDVHAQRPRADDFVMCGRTDAGILRELLARLPEPKAELSAQLWARYCARIDAALDARPPRPLAGVYALLERLRRQPEYLLGLLTGNHADVAWNKLERIGMAGYFDFGAFGHLHPEREALPALARERAQALLAPGHHAQFVIVGDTPRDIACARSADWRVIAVATGHFEAAELSAEAPDALLNSLEERDAFMAALQGWRR